VTPASQKEKLKSEKLIVPGRGHVCFCQRVDASGLAPSFRLGTRTSALPHHRLVREMAWADRQLSYARWGDDCHTR